MRPEEFRAELAAYFDEPWPAPVWAAIVDDVNRQPPGRLRRVYDKLVATVPRSLRRVPGRMEFDQALHAVGVDEQPNRPSLPQPRAEEGPLRAAFEAMVEALPSALRSEVLLLRKVGAPEDAPMVRVGRRDRGPWGDL